MSGFVNSSQLFESFVPVYDTVPESWEDGRAFLVEHLKKISNAVNAREIGYFLDEELLSGKQFYPGASANVQQFRSILRKVVNCSPLVAGVNTFPHGITVDINFTLIQMFAAASDATTPFDSEPIPNGADALSMDNTNIYITVADNWDRANTTIEYIQEL
jgi:hypothetical protein